MSSVRRGQQIQAGDVSRREFLRVGGLSVVSLSVAEQAASARARERFDRRNCIFLLMTGGPSQFETFDPKPEAPAEIRGPLRAIQTAVPGVAFSESLPRLAERADQFTVLRSLYHDAAPIHETGQQLLQTGRLARGDLRHPSIGSLIARTLGPRGNAPSYVVLPRLLSHTGVNAYHGQEAGFLGAAFEPVVVPLDEQAVSKNGRRIRSRKSSSSNNDAEALRRDYGETRFGRLCLQARRLVEQGVRVVTVNLFDTLTGQVTWDCHGRGPWSGSTLFDYRDLLCPQFDRAFSALIDDLQQRGLWDDTLVVAVGEFGRTPRVNENGGRDHWPGVWSALIAGGSVPGGQVVGASDKLGAAPAERPAAAAELTATILHALGLNLDAKLATENGMEYPIADSRPIEELIVG